MKTIAFGASTSTQSINKALANFVASTFVDSHQLLDLNDFPLPLYSTDEEQRGIPENTVRFYDKIQEADAVVISIAEHNGGFTAAFKNLYDWLTRHDINFLNQTHVILTSTSPGPGGAKSALAIAANSFPRNGANVLGTFTLPKFQESFSTEKGIIDSDKKAEFDEFIHTIFAKL